MAVVFTGNQCSPQFAIAQGSRQGCPASALLFAQSLTQKVQNSQEMKEIAVKGTNHKTHLYTDDQLIYPDHIP